jgi:amidophosphoribosyltransferase
VDTSNRSELIGARCSVEQIRDAIGADSLGYQSVAGLLKGLGISRRKLCLACFTGRYPIAIPKDVKLSKLDLEKDEWREDKGDAETGTGSQ